MEKPKYRRVLLKISGEALAGDKHFGLDFGVIGQVTDVIKECVEAGVQMGIVIGGGNFWRGVKNGEGYIERTRADHMGMLATAMNCMAVADVLEQKGVDVRIQTALEIKEVAELVARTVGYEGEIRWDASRPNGTPRKLLDISRSVALGWTPKTSLEDGLKLAYDDFLHNPMRVER